MELLSLQRYGVAIGGCEEGFWTVAGCVFSSDVKLGKTLFFFAGTTVFLLPHLFSKHPHHITTEPTPLESKM